MRPFTLAVAGDRRLGVAHYRFFRAHLDRLLGNHLPRVRVLSGAGQNIDVLAERWAEEHRLPVERYPGMRDYRTESLYLAWLFNSRPDGVVVFDGGADVEAELARHARAKGAAVRVVDARMIVIGKT
jgi:hypothetical protein